ncbi:MAG: 6-phosphofructokinase [Patescibacteria group bacterium]
MKILVFTGGGLSPALNSLLYGVITAAQKNEWQIWGGAHGWRSLLEDNLLIDLTDFDAEKIKNQTGNLLRSSRINPYKIGGGVGQIKKKIAEQNFDAVIAIGGDDTLGAAQKLAQEEDLPIVGLPKTIDNDLTGTYWTPGYPSAAAAFADYLKKIKMHAAYNLSRIFVVEALGYDAGWLAAAGIYGLADVIVPSEKETDWQKFLEITKKRYRANGHYALVVVAQHARFNKELTGLSDTQADQFGTKRTFFICTALADAMKNDLGLEVRALYPGNYLEAADILPLEYRLSVEMGQKAVDLIKEKKFGLAAVLVRPDPKSMDMAVTECDLAQMTGENNYRRLPDEFFNFEELTVTQKYLDYMEPALGQMPAQTIYEELQKQFAQL